MKSLFGAFSCKKKRSVDEDEAQADDNFEEMQEEQEAVETGDMIEAAVNSDRSSAQIREGLQNIMDDSNTHPIQYGGLDLCGLADSILRKLSPLDELTENESSKGPGRARSLSAGRRQLISLCYICSQKHTNC